MEIKENYLPKKEYDLLFDAMTNHWFPWGFVPVQVASDHDGSPYYSSPDINDWHLTHMVYDGQYNSPHQPVFNYLVHSLNAEKIYRVKANLLLPCGEHVKSGFHTDGDDVKTTIFYLNTCNGYTELEDGTKIDCVKNRLATFDSNIKHNAVRQTDTKTRYVINIMWS